MSFLAGCASRLVRGLTHEVCSAVRAASYQGLSEGGLGPRAMQQQQKLEAAASALYRLWFAALMDALTAQLKRLLLHTAAAASPEFEHYSFLLTDALRSVAKSRLLNLLRRDLHAVPLVTAFAELEEDLFGATNGVAALLPVCYSSFRQQVASSVGVTVQLAI